MNNKLPPGDWSYRFACLILRWMFRFTGGLKLIGAENIPAEGGAILASNHISHVDPPGVACKLKRHVRFMAKEELWHPWIMGVWMDSVGNFPVRRGTADRRAIKTAVELLQEGALVGIFPEGTRSLDGKLQAAEMGLGLIVMKAKASVIPAAIKGSNQVLPPGAKRLHRHPVTVVYGKPLTFDDLFEQKESRESMEEIGRRTMAAIAELQAGLNQPTDKVVL